VEVVGGAGFEFWYEVQVEVLRLWCLGVHQQTACADPFRQLEQSGEHVREKGRSEAVAFVGGIHSETGQQGHRLGIPSAPLASRRVTASVVTCAMHDA
jgi:hypothetical protein